MSIVITYNYFFILILYIVIFFHTYNYRLKVDVGYYHKTIEVQSLILEKSRYLEGIINGILTVVGRELGNKMMCLDSFEALR